MSPLHYRFEQTLAWHCAPSLAGIKAADLLTWTVEGREGADLLSHYADLLSSRGIRLYVLGARRGRTLLLIFRPRRLDCWLAQAKVREMLDRAGYPVSRGTMETVVSGIRPTGNLHLGNYFGAVKSFLRMQDEYNCFFFIADWHSLTTHPHPDNIRNSVKTILSEYLACGIDPEKATIYIQSDVPEVVELYLYLNMNAGIGELMRTASFKDKARQQLHISREGCEGDVEKEIFNEGNKHSVSAGLLTYPTLMAADIIIHKALKVPVGKDQEQNMEMARRFARRFNSTYGVDFFPEPASFHLGDKSVKVPGLDGSGKMGKSEGNAIYLIDDEKTIKKKVMKAVSDAGPTEPNSVKPEPIANLFTMMEIVSEKETYDFFNEKYNNCEIRYGDMKKQLAEDINKFCAPIRERILDMAANTEYLDKVARMGAEKARESASKTLNEVRQIIGFRPY